MSYLSNIRIITTREGFENLKEELEEAREFIGNIRMVAKIENNVYFGYENVVWDDWLGYCKTIQNKLIENYDNNIPSRFARLGEKLGDYEQLDYDDNDELPEFTVKQYIDDSNILKNL